MNGNIKNLEMVLDTPQDKILLWMALKYKLVFLLVSLHVSVGRKLYTCCIIKSTDINCGFLEYC